MKVKSILCQSSNLYTILGEIINWSVLYLDDKEEGIYVHTQAWEVCYKIGRKSVVSTRGQKMGWPEIIPSPYL